MPTTLRARDLFLLSLLALLLRLFAIWTVPLAAGTPDMNCAPDEVQQLRVAQDLADGHTPTWPGQSSSIYAAFLPTPFAVQAAAIQLAHLFHSAPALERFSPIEPVARNVAFARLGSALLGILTCLALAGAVAAFTSSARAGMWAGALAAVWPQFVFIGAYTNADAFTLAMGALLCWALARWAHAGERDEGLWLVGVSAGLVLVAKPSGYFLLPPAAMWIGWALVKTRSIKPVAALRAFVAALATCSPVFIFNAVRNRGDALGLGRYHHFLAEVWHGQDGRAISHAGIKFATALFISSFGLFANMSLPLPKGLYVGAALFFALGLVAAILLWRTTSGRPRRGPLFVAAAAALNFALVAWNSWFVDFQPQGRYLMLSTLLVACAALLSPPALAPSFEKERPRWALAMRAWPWACAVFLSASALTAEAVLYRHPCH